MAQRLLISTGVAVLLAVALGCGDARTSLSRKVEVVDIASAFDDKTIPPVLHWVIVEGPPGYDPYANHPGC